MYPIKLRPRDNQKTSGRSKTQGRRERETSRHISQADGRRDTSSHHLRTTWNTSFFGGGKASDETGESLRITSSGGIFEAVGEK